MLRFNSRILKYNGHMPGTVKFDNSLLRDLIALLSGALLVFAFAPFQYFYLAILAPTLLLWVWVSTGPKRAALRGALFGLSFFGCGISWVFISIHVYGNTSVALSVLITALLIIIMTCYIALNAYWLRRFFPGHGANTLLLAFPVMWVLLEWLRGWLFTGFPWLFLGYSQINSPLRGFAPLGSVYLVSFAVALCAGLLLYCFLHHRKALYSIIGLLLVIGLGSIFSTIQWTKPTGNALHVALVQGNIPQSLKWDPNQAADTLRVYRKLTDQHWNSDIIVWPEAAIPMWLDSVPHYIEQLSDAATKHHVSLIVGVPTRTDSAYFNSMIGLGTANGQYSKRHLVPFGEYVPLEDMLRGLIGFFNLPMSGFSPGSPEQIGVDIGNYDVATYICYEIAYPAEFLTQFPTSKLIVTISDDAWFGNSWAPAQQLQISQMRSLETGRYQLASTNNGITAIIDPQGRINARAPQFERVVLTGKIYAMRGNTPLVILGLTPIIFIFFVLLGIAILYRPQMLQKIRVANT